jgi:hypothetical protein
MAAVWSKNEIAATKRRCDMLITKSDGSMAPRQTSFTSLGYVYICGATSPHFAVGTGTLTNKRKPLVVADDTVESVNAVSNLVQMTAHGLQIGDGPFRWATGGPAPPTGLSTGVDYWIVPFDANNISFATSLANAYAGTLVDITGTGTGGILQDTATTQRGLDGHFTYEASQVETDHDAPETIVIVDGSTYERSLGYGGFTTVNMGGAMEAAFDGVLENGLTRDDAQRVILRTLAAKFAKVGNDYTYRDMADSKDSHTGTVTSAGRTARNIIDAT